MNHIESIIVHCANQPSDTPYDQKVDFCTSTLTFPYKWDANVFNTDYIKGIIVCHAN